MTEKERALFRQKIEEQAEAEGWPTFQVTILVPERTERTSIEIAGRSAHHARMSAMILAVLSLRGEMVDCKVAQTS